MHSDNFEFVASADDIPDEGVHSVVRSNGQRICLIKSNGRISAVADNCTHQDFEMALGDVLPDGTIQCAWHGARFDCATGEVIQGPATEPLPVFEVRITGSRVLVGPRLGQQFAATPQSAVGQQSPIGPQSPVGPRSKMAVDPQSAAFVSESLGEDPSE